MLKDHDSCEGIGEDMPHDNIRLATAPNGEIGPCCHKCGTRLTFGSAMVIDDNYYCWDDYVLATGADTSTVVGNHDKPFYMDR